MLAIVFTHVFTVDISNNIKSMSKRSRSSTTVDTGNIEEGNLNSRDVATQMCNADKNILLCQAFLTSQNTPKLTCSNVEIQKFSEG